MKPIPFFLSLLVIMGLHFQCPAHDLKRAVFYLQNESGRLVCHVRADRVRTIEALKFDLSNAQLQEYINTHLSISIDSKEPYLEVRTYKLTEEFIEINLDLGIVGSDPVLIEIKNDFLISEVSGHENIVHLNLHGKIRSFSMNAARTEITVNYKS